jgi:glycosyltransferase involved in cell wall biosynthesis
MLKRTMLAKALPRVTYVARSFLDYRVPVFKALNLMLENRLHVLYSTRWTPERVQQKISAALESHAIGLSGERSLGVNMPEVANQSICIPFQPGLLRAIAKLEPDILIGDGFFHWTYVGLIYRLWRKVPLVVCYERTFHTERNAQWYRIAYRRLAIKLVDAICCNGQMSVEYTRWLGMPSSRITVGHMVADTESLSHHASVIDPDKREAIRLQLGCRGLVFLFVGRLIDSKGVRELLDSWVRFENINPGVGTLVIVGTGPEESSLRSQAEKLRLQAVRFVGSVDYDDIASYYAAADVFVIPTLEDNWSLVVPEAMACGLPILCSKYNGCWPELVQEHNGWVFDPLDVKDILHSLNLCITHKSNLKQMGQRSRAIINQHTPKQAAQSIYDACMIAAQHQNAKKRFKI